MWVNESYIQYMLECMEEKERWKNVVFPFLPLDGVWNLAFRFYCSKYVHRTGTKDRPLLAWSVDQVVRKASPTYFLYVSLFQRYQKRVGGVEWDRSPAVCVWMKGTSQRHMCSFYFFEVMASVTSQPVWLLASWRILGVTVQKVTFPILAYAQFLKVWRVLHLDTPGEHHFCWWAGACHSEHGQKR